jgi:hypothetical protein
MSLAIKLSPESAVSRYDDLVAAVRRRLDDDNYSAEAIARAVTLAEAHFRRELPMASTDVTVGVTIIGMDPGTNGADYVGLGGIRGPVYPYLKPLTADAPVNWLIERHPDLYLSGTLYYVYLDDRNTDGAAAELQAINTFLASARRSEILSQWAGGPLIPMGFGQVRGARM